MVPAKATSWSASFLASMASSLLLSLQMAAVTLSQQTRATLCPLGGAGEGH